MTQPIRSCSTITVALLAALLTASRAGAQPLDADVLPGLIVEDADVPSDAFGQPQLDGVPGARERQPLPVEVQRRLQELSAQRAAVGALAPGGAVPAPLDPPAGADAPPRRDSGARDPDRVSTSPAPPRDR